MLDTQSLCYAAATCSLFNKCARDPSCYANIDLTTVVPKVNNAVVSTMIHRAGKALRLEIFGKNKSFICSIVFSYSYVNLGVIIYASYFRGFLIAIYFFIFFSD
jgi:hypothetical protein